MIEARLIALGPPDIVENNMVAPQPQQNSVLKLTFNT
jgi:hypothetical protein